MIRKSMGLKPNVMSDEYNYMLGLINKEGRPRNGSVKRE